jgi:hypothetical protein
MFAELEKHQHKTNKLVRDTIKRAAIPFGMKIKEATEAFKSGHVTLTIDFWKIINSEHPNKYNRVDYCHGCRKFNLY